MPTSNLYHSLATGLPAVDDLPDRLAGSSPSFVEVEFPSLVNDTGFSQQRQPDDDASYDRVIGRIFAWLCTTLYLTS